MNAPQINHSRRISLLSMIFISMLLFSCAVFAQTGLSYPVLDTGQEECYDTTGVIISPLPGEPFFGQDAQYSGIQFSFHDNNDGTVSDLQTGLMWQKYLFADKYSYEEILAIADTFSLNGYDDWRLPSIKELYSLIDFSGVIATDTANSIPFIDTDYFQFRYGNPADGERIIDAQYASSTVYAGTTMNGAFTLFGVNFADGRIKGYGTTMMGGTEKLFEVKFVRGNSTYGVNDFLDNNNGTITDRATGLMWSTSDCGSGLNWEAALAWVAQKNQESYLGYSDWRLPNVKELQSIVDYTRCPQTTNSAAIDPMFDVTPITDEGGNSDFPFYWSSTTHADGPEDSRYKKASYVAFGEALGFMEFPPNSGTFYLLDVHGAGAQRSDPKQGDPNEYPHGFGPQGDVIRIFNFVRLVRDAAITDIGESGSEIPAGFTLDQNFPNPFNPTTQINYSVPFSANVTMKVFDVLGNEIASLVNEQKQTGTYTASWNAAGFPSGVYFYAFRAGNFSETKKMILLK